MLAIVGNTNTAAREPVSALVDTVSTFSMLLANLLQRLGIAPTRPRRLRYANGSIEEYQTGTAYFEVDGTDGVAMVVFGPDDVYLLGATTLETLLLVVDQINQLLIPEVGLLMRGSANHTC